MNILVTGGAGFIGSYTVDLLIQNGHNVTVIDNLSSGIQENIPESVDFLCADICEPLPSSLYKQEFDAIIHLAAQTSVPQSMIDPFFDIQQNIVGTLNMLKYAQEMNIRKFIFSSTAAVYGNNINLPLTEEESLNPNSPYGISKMTAEKYIKHICEISDIDYIIYRYSNAYGPKQTKNGEGGVIKIFLENSITNQPILIYGDGNQTRDFIYVRDIAKANLNALSVKSGVYNVSSNEEISVNKLCSVIEKCLPIKLDLKYLDVREGDIYRNSLNNNKLMSLGWAPQYSLDEGINETLNILVDTKNKV